MFSVQEYSCLLFQLQWSSLFFVNNNIYLCSIEKFSSVNLFVLMLCFYAIALRKKAMFWIGLLIIFVPHNSVYLRKNKWEEKSLIWISIISGLELDSLSAYYKRHSLYTVSLRAFWLIVVKARLSFFVCSIWSVGDMFTTLKQKFV